LEVLVRVFVTGASGWIGSALVPELLSGGHLVVGLARSDAAASRLRALGAEVQRGDLGDLETLGAAARAADGVVHLAFNHDTAFSGGFAGAADLDRRAVETLGEALAGSDRPLVIASGTLGLAHGRTATESDGRGPDPEAAALGGGPLTRLGTAQLALALADRGVRSSVVRLPPTCHGQGDEGFISMLVEIARNRGVSGYVGDGSNRWPAAHRTDAARLFAMALERAPAGAALHAVAEEGVAIRDVAEAIGRHLELPVGPVDEELADEHFGFLAWPLRIDGPTSSTETRERLGWQPTGPGLLADLEAGHYFSRRTPARAR
jgi:nucleoside-diphosphate-sugar epimerase